MTDQATTRPDGVAPPTWRVVLCDWYNADATVTITTKSGKTFTGKVDRHPTHWLHDMANLVEQTAYGETTARHSIDLTEVAAITAKPSR